MLTGQMAMDVDTSAGAGLEPVTLWLQDGLSNFMNTSIQKYRGEGILHSGIFPVFGNYDYPEI